VLSLGETFPVQSDRSGSVPRYDAQPSKSAVERHRKDSGNRGKRHPNTIESLSSLLGCPTSAPVPAMTADLSTGDLTRAEAFSFDSFFSNAEAVISGTSSQGIDSTFK